MPISHANLFSAQIPSGRLTLTSGSPVTTTDVTAVSTLYYTPYVGNTIQLYDGVGWQAYKFAEISLALGSLTSGYNYDIWAYENGGAVTLDSTIWTNNSTRATALAFQDGVYVKSGTPTRRYIGTIRIFNINTDIYCADSVTKRFVWNMYNQVYRNVSCEESTDHTYNSATPRLWNNSTTNNYGEIVLGLDTTCGQTISTVVAASADNANADTTLYMDGAESLFTRQKNAYYGQCGLTKYYILTAGYHYFSAYEASSTGTASFKNMVFQANWKG